MGEPACTTLSEGKAFIKALTRSGKYSGEQLADIVDSAIECVREMSQYRILYSEMYYADNISEFILPRGGVLEI